MILAPIALFVYNRPWHTEQTLHALMQNELADKSILYIYADGPKENASEEQLKQIQKVRQLIRTQQWCSDVFIVEKENNLGLANSIINGVTEILNKHDKVIVLEDDIVPSKGFLKYMNESLRLYEKEDRVGCIHAWNYNLDTSANPESTFFLKGADCWGWATWKRSWSLFNPDGIFLLESILSKNMQYEFDRRGTHNYEIMLRDQTEGKNDSWAIRWHASLFLQNKYCLQPARAIVKNIGFDNSGVHSGIADITQDPVDFMTLTKIEIHEPDWFFKAFEFYQQKKETPTIEKKKGLFWLRKLKAIKRNIYG
jgi:hypothetical protein